MKGISMGSAEENIWAYDKGNNKKADKEMRVL
jgi:hypothetical protein